MIDPTEAFPFARRAYERFDAEQPAEPAEVPALPPWDILLAGACWFAFVLGWVLV